MRIEQTAALDAAGRDEVEDLAARADAVDGVGPLSEHSMLRLRHEDPTVRHLCVLEEGHLVGYAQLELGGPDRPAVAELVVDPRSRRRGVGRLLVAELLTASSPGSLQVWAHGDHPAAERLAEGYGLSRVRTLWQLRRSLTDPLPAATMPDGVTVRAFRPVADDHAWVTLNARAFADHPEQGRWTLADLRHRTEQGWFDPAGFFVAERVDQRGLVGFHWTKVHPARAAEAAIGEVYVLGVDPKEQGSGLGRALLLVGLQHLRDLGLTAVMLYVEADNARAMRLYEGLGFDRHRADVMFAG